MEISVAIMVHGVAQGVGFRPFIYRNAKALNLKGYVRNRGDAAVKIAVKGDEKSIQEMIRRIKSAHPPPASIEKIEVHKINDKLPDDFQILKSDRKSTITGSTVPADISICNKCIAELQKAADRRYRYFFITCTECGPRFTIIEGLPYDRETTSMKDFKLCRNCEGEYTDPLNRRFHAQTIACSLCGPKVKLMEKNGEKVETDNPIEESGKLIEEGSIVAVKGNGGYHIAASTIKNIPIQRLREAKHRKHKPFAVMAKSITAARGFAYINDLEEKTLLSPVKPILLVKLKEDSPISSLVAPGLSHVGIMLPYTGLHIMLFDQVDEPAFIMTSANPPNQPIITGEEEAYEKLKDVCDYFLTHSRRVSNRCDDSVLKIVGGKVSYLRRSRGYTPLPIHVKSRFKRTVLGVGGELNNTVCFFTGNKAFLSQHIGDVETLETRKFLKESIARLKGLTCNKIDAVACDMHPTYNTTRIAEEISDNLGIQLLRIQHHHAHASKLMADNDLDHLIAVVCDGYGYGLNGSAWGGEILYCEEESFERIGHLQEYAMIGGDLATRFPLRMLASILIDEPGFEEWFISKADKLPRGVPEAELILKDAHRGVGVKTSSCGRLLDAVSTLLEVCFQRTYEGEPAMKLEAAAENGRIKIGLPYSIQGDKVITQNIVKDLFRIKNSYEMRDLAYSVHQSIASALADYAIQEAKKRGVDPIGFTGGVAYNNIITEVIGRRVLQAGHKFILQKNVPCGDGGLSFGQAYMAQKKLE